MREHNELARRAAALAWAAYNAGATYVIENPVDRGAKGSPFFSARFRKHAPLWLLPEMQELANRTSPEWVSFAHSVRISRRVSEVDVPYGGGAAGGSTSRAGVGAVHTRLTRAWEGGGRVGGGCSGGGLPANIQRSGDGGTLSK